METNDLQTLWQQYDERLNALEPDPFIARDAALDGVRTTLGRLTRTLRFELIANGIAIVFLGGFAADHFHQTRVFAAATALDVYAIAIFAALVAQLVLVMRLDYVSPIYPIARALGTLELLRARATLATLAVAPLMWVPLLIVSTQAFLGIDAVTAMGMPWVAANLAFGCVVLVAALLLARHFAQAEHRPHTLQHILDSLSGRDVQDAAQHLYRLISYEL